MGFYEYGNEPSGYLKDGKSHELHSYYHLAKENYAELRERGVIWFPLFVFGRSWLQIPAQKLAVQYENFHSPPPSKASTRQAADAASRILSSYSGNLSIIQRYLIVAIETVVK